MTVNEFLSSKIIYETSIDRFDFCPEEMSSIVRPAIVCKDGYKISIQASFAHYCEPEITQCGPYESVELGFPSAEDELINEYAEDAENDGYTRTIYGFVPVDVVDKLLEKHGGIAFVKYNIDKLIRKDRK